MQCSQYAPGLAEYGDLLLANSPETTTDEHGSESERRSIVSDSL